MQMNKSTLSIALLLAFAAPVMVHAADAPAPLTVTVGTDTTLSLTGLLAAGVKFTTVTDTARAAQTQTRVDDNTSRFTFSGSSKFADGLRGIFRVESRFTTDNRPGTALVPGTTTNVAAATGWADGDTWVGLAGSWGQVIVGKSSLYYADTLAMPYLGIPGAGEGYRTWDTNGLATFNMLSQVGNNTGAVATLGITRSQNVIRYDSPKFANIDVAVAYTPNASGDEPHITSCTPVAPGVTGTVCNDKYTSGGTAYVRLRYTEGPLHASFSYLNQKVAGGLYSNALAVAPLDTVAYRAGVTYTMPMGLRVGVVYDSTDIANGIVGTTKNAKRDVFSLPVSYAWGKHQAHLTYTQAGATSNIDASGANQLNLGYDYALSRTTFLGVNYTKLKNDANGRYTPFLAGTSLGGDAPGKGEGSQQLSFDINYWF
jgi:predicted porin